MFSLMLEEQLIKHGDALQRRHRFRYRLGFPRLIAGNWDQAYAADLIPARELYADWDNKWAYPPTRWQRFKRAFKGGKLADWLDL